ncbi:hypothetical protein Leryth_027060 [Lithospermum erythrorhizon]|nr:hypothetical protein Leryth_027060 [Lithospermum erythrorhizon]
MRVMGVKGLTLYHLKSHLQKFRLGKQPHREYDHSIKDSERASMELQKHTASSSGMMNRSMNEMQMEVQRRLHEQLEVQRHLQLRIEAQGKYMQTILEKACQTLANESMAAASGSYNNNKATMGNIHHGIMMPPDISTLKDFGQHQLPLSFPPLQDLNIYGGGHHELDQLHHQQDGFMQNNDNLLCLGNNKKKRPSNNFCYDDLRLQDLGGPTTSQDDPFEDENHNRIQLAPLSIDRGENDIDSVSSDHLFNTKQIFDADNVFCEKKQLERPSPKRINPSVMVSGPMQQGRSSPFNLSN